MRILLRVVIVIEVIEHYATNASGLSRLLLLHERQAGRRLEGQLVPP